MVVGLAGDRKRWWKSPTATLERNVWWEQRTNKGRIADPASPGAPHIAEDVLVQKNSNYDDDTNNDRN
jgi:hypothetical protein